MNTLIIYSTIDGQTKAICEKISQVCRDAGERVTIATLSEAQSIGLAEFEKVLIGASIRYGKHRPELFDFIKRHRQLLDGRVCGFFSVNVVARKPLKSTPETNPYMQKFAALSQWHPKYLAVFAGKIDYPKYRYFDRFMIRFIMWMTKGPTDIRGTFEFTDWNQVESFAQTFSKAK